MDNPNCSNSEKERKNSECCSCGRDTRSCTCGEKLQKSDRRSKSFDAECPGSPKEEVNKHDACCACGPSSKTVKKRTRSLCLKDKQEQTSAPSALKSAASCVCGVTDKGRPRTAPPTDRSRPASAEKKEKTAEPSLKQDGSKDFISDVEKVRSGRVSPTPQKSYQFPTTPVIHIDPEIPDAPERKRMAGADPNCICVDPKRKLALRGKPGQLAPGQSHMDSIPPGETYQDQDPMCDPNNPIEASFEDITSAAFKIRGGIITTPCIKSHVSNIVGMDVYLKQDFLQYTGSFKERGARYALTMLPDEKKKIGVIGASLGNHAQGLSYHGMKLGIPVTVVMPITAPITKITKCRNYQANVVIDGKDMAEAKLIALKLARESGMTYVNGYDHPHIIAGQGTMGLEIVEQVENIDAVVVPIGGGGLIAGVGLAIKTLHPNVKIIGVEGKNVAGWVNAQEHGKPCYTEIGPSLADGLAVSTVGYNAFHTVNKLLDRVVLVSEEWIALAILRMIELEKCVVEGAGACPLAAVLSGQLDDLKGQRIVLVLSGGNIDSTILGRCLERGLAADGRLIKMKVLVSDRPGGIGELCRLIASIGVSIKDIIHERAWVKQDVFSVEVKAILETRDYEHAMELKALVEEAYEGVIFSNFPGPDSSKVALPLFSA